MSGWQQRRWGRGAGAGNGRGPGNNRRDFGRGGGNGRRRRRNNGGGGGGPVVGSSHVESIDLSTVGTYATITSIDGIDLSEFAYVFGFFRDAATTISVTAIRAELSVDGSIWRAGASDYRNGSYDQINSDGSSTGFLPVHNEGGASVDATFVLSNIKGAAPTSMRANEINTTSSITQFSGFSDAAVEDQAIRFYDQGGEDWAGGTLELFGVIGGTPTIQTHDFGVTGGNKTFTIPAGHVVGTVYADALTCSSSAQAAIRLSTGGVPLAGASDYRLGYMNAAASGGLDVGQVGLTDGGTSGLTGLGFLWGLNTAVPTIIDVCQMNPSTANPSIASGAPKAVTPVTYEEIQIISTAGSLNGGVVTLITWPGTVDVEEVDFGAAAAATHDFTDLEGYPIVAMVAPTLTIASSGAAFLRTSTDGVSFDSGVSDYRYGQLHHATSGSGTDDQMNVAGTNTTAKGFSALIGGLGAAGYTVNEYQEFGPASGPLRGQSVRDAAQINVALRLANSAAANFNAGKVYRAGIALTE